MIAWWWLIVAAVGGSFVISFFPGVEALRMARRRGFYVGWRARQQALPSGQHRPTPPRREIDHLIRSDEQ